MPKTGGSGHRSVGVEPVIVAAVAFAFYAATGARHIQWGDPAKLMLYVHELEFSFAQEGHVGLVAWSWPFSLVPVGTLALRLHLSSALTLGASLGVLHATLLGLGRSTAAARLAVASVAVAHTIWFTGTMFESYPLVLLILAVAGWLMAVRRSTITAGLLLGLGVTVHPLCLFGVPGMMCGLWLRDGAGSAARLVLGLAAGLAIPVIGMAGGQTGASLPEVNWASATARYADFDNPVRNVPLLLGYALYNFASPAIGLVLLGLTRLDRGGRLTALLFAAPHYLVAAFWLPQRSYLIPIPVYFAAALPIALGAERAFESLRIRASVMFGLVVIGPVIAYLSAPAIFTWAGLDRTVRDAPYRVEASYFLRPWKMDETSARDYLADLSRELPPDAVVVADWVLHTTLHAAQQVNGWRPDVLLVSADPLQCEAIMTLLSEGRRTFVLDDEPGYLPACVLALRRLPASDRVESLQRVAPTGR